MKTRRLAAGKSQRGKRRVPQRSPARAARTLLNKSPQGVTHGRSQYGNQHQHIGCERRTPARRININATKVAGAALFWFKDCESGR
ncbi:MAG: hypothetical protein ACP5K7_10000 [Verrucomicrobiia bacterium]